MLLLGRHWSPRGYSTSAWYRPKMTVALVVGYSPNRIFYIGNVGNHSVCVK